MQKAKPSRLLVEALGLGAIITQTFGVQVRIAIFALGRYLIFGYLDRLVRSVFLLKPDLKQPAFIPEKYHGDQKKSNPETQGRWT